MLEKELKYGLTRTNYQKLLRSQTGRKRVEYQTNVFFDTPTLELRRRKIALRLRMLKHGSSLLTLKCPPPHRSRSSSRNRAIHIRQEWETPFAQEKAMAVIRTPSRLKTMLPKPFFEFSKRLFPENLWTRIRPLGKMTTRRTLVYLPSFLLEVDRCEMFGRIFYELEVETKYPEKVDKQIRSLLRANDIRFFPEPRSKFSRFVKYGLEKRYGLTFGFPDAS